MTCLLRHSFIHSFIDWLCLSVLCRSSTAVRCLQTIGFLPSWCTSAKIQDGRSKTNTRKRRLADSTDVCKAANHKSQFPPQTITFCSLDGFRCRAGLQQQREFSQSSISLMLSSVASFSVRKMLKSLCRNVLIINNTWHITRRRHMFPVELWGCFFYGGELSLVIQNETTSVWLVWVIIIQTFTDGHRHVVQISLRVSTQIFSMCAK